MSSRWRALVAALLTASVVAVGCSSTDDDTEAAEPGPATTIDVDGNDAPDVLRDVALAQNLTIRDGGEVLIEHSEGRESYDGSTRNGVTTQSWGSWHGTFVFIGATGQPVTGEQP